MNDDVYDRTDLIDEPELVGATWWRRGLASADGGVDRRTALRALTGLGAVGALGMIPGCGGDDADSTLLPPPPPNDNEVVDALAFQQSEGWNAGAAKETLAFPPGGAAPAPELLTSLATQLTPKDVAHRPFYGPVLFQSLAPTPSTPVDGASRALAADIQTVHTPDMQDAFLAGAGLSEAFDGAPAGTAVVVDLPGPEAIAFAAGLADRFDPVFYFDNWPHPLGVVDAHHTLGAALHYAPQLADHAAARPRDAPPMFVLDAERLAEFEDERTVFDNRYVARLPSGDAMRRLNVQRVIYVRPRSDDRELDDVNQTLVSWNAVGIDVQMVPLDRFDAPPRTDPQPEPSGAQSDVRDGTYASSGLHRPDRPYRYGGSILTHWLLWSHLGWGRPRWRTSPERLRRFRNPVGFRPVPRTTSFSTSRPQGFGQVAVDKGSGRRTLARRQPRVSTRGRGTSRSSSSSSSSRGSWGRTAGGRSSS